MVFFQYWVTFFSTIFIIYFYINIFYVYGTSDWFVIQFLNTLDVENNNTNVAIFKLLIIIFLLSVFFKLGITPFHLFKVEVYKGIPYLSIFFYTTYYFIIFFIFFLFLLSDYLGAFITQYYLFLVLLLFLGSIYVIILLFDVSFLKAFFTYSTIINTIGFFVVFLSSL
jgi:NADH:ubiquinone oxidoreductase subunit 2 (subunit N)